MSIRGRNRDIVEFFRKNADMDEGYEHLIGQAVEIITLFHKVLKGYKLYPVNNPMFKKFAEEFKVKIDLMHTEIPVIPFRIKKTGFLFLKHPVETALDDNEVFYVLFNDGIREIYFQKGLTFEEIYAFFNILAKVTVYASVDYDIATLLWDSEFQHIGYVTEEELVESEPFEQDDFEQTYDLMARSALGGRGITPERAPEREVPFQNRDMFLLSEKDREIFAELLTRFPENSITSRFLKELTEKLTSGTNDSIKNDLVDTASLLWERLLLFGAVRESVVFLRTLIKIGSQFREKNEGFYQKIKAGVANLANDDFLDKVFKLAENIEPDQYEYFGELLAIVPPLKLDYIVIKLTDIETRELRIACLEKVAKNIRNFDVFKTLLHHDDWKVIRNALSLMKATNNPQVVPLLRNVINHPQKQIRIEAIAILMSYSIEEALPALEKAVFSPDKEVRLMSAEKLFELKNPQVKTVVNRFMQESNLLKIGPEESDVYIKKIVEHRRHDLYDLISVMLFSKTPWMKAAAFKYLPLIDDTSPIIRHIVKMIDSPDFEKMKKEELETFIKLIRVENFVQTIPLLEKVLTFSGGMFSKGVYKEFKDIVISHLNQFRSDPSIKLFFKKGLQCGNKETEEIIKQKGGIL